jgi:hypothetical protein
LDPEGMTCKLFSLTLLASALVQRFVSTEAWSFTEPAIINHQTLFTEYSGIHAEEKNIESGRRKAFALLPKLILPCLGWNSAHHSAQAVTMEKPEQNVFKVGEALGAVSAKARFREARKTLDYLIENYEVISKEGGDNVRRYLGTVGTTSALYGITKVLKELQDEAEDIVEYTENMQDFGYWLGAADTAVYSANFVEFSSASTKPEKFFKDAKAAAELMKGYMDVMASELGV